MSTLVIVALAVAFGLLALLAWSLCAMARAADERARMDERPPRRRTDPPVPPPTAVSRPVERVLEQRAPQMRKRRTGRWE